MYYKKIIEDLQLIINNINNINKIYFDCFNVKTYDNITQIFSLSFDNKNPLIFGLDRKNGITNNTEIDNVIFVTNFTKVKIKTLLIKILYSKVKIIAYDSKTLFYNLNEKIDFDINKINIYKDYIIDCYINNIKQNKRSYILKNNDEKLKSYETLNNLFILSNNNEDIIKCIKNTCKSFYILDYIINNNKLNNIYINMLKLIHKIKQTGVYIKTDNYDIKYKNILNELKNNFYYIDYNLTKTITGRLSSNYHTLDNNFKKYVKSRFEDKNGYMISIDFKQIELRVLASLSEDKLLLNDINGGLDLHQQTAERLNLDSRQLGKVVNFGILYGISAFTLAKKINISEPEATQIINKYYNDHQCVKEFILKTKNQIIKSNVLMNPYGFRISIESDLFATQDEINQLKRKSINYMIQSTSSIFVLDFTQTLFNLINYNGLSSYIFGLVHDCIEIDVCPGEQNKILKLLAISQQLSKQNWMKCNLDYKITKI